LGRELCARVLPGAEEMPGSPAQYDDVYILGQYGRKYRREAGETDDMRSAHTTVNITASSSTGSGAGSPDGPTNDAALHELCNRMSHNYETLKSKAGGVKTRATQV
jgi:hypothetical protein